MHYGRIDNVQMIRSEMMQSTGTINTQNRMNAIPSLAPKSKPFFIFIELV